MPKEWIVTLYNHEDLESFYEDMETPGGSLYIPDRAVDLAKRRPMSRNTHYMLTFEEAELLRQDERVWGVELLELIEMSTRPAGYKITTGNFAKDWGADANDINWGLLRQSETTNRTNWGDNGSSNVGANIPPSPENNSVLIIGGEGDAHVSIQNELQAAGHTVTYNSGTSLPSISGYQQVWDLRYNTAISSSDISQYNTFLQNRGFLYITGENAGFATRNNSISNFVSQLGGGTLSVPGNALDTQTANVSYFPNQETVSYAAAAEIINSGGTGRRLTTDSLGKSTAMMWIGNAGDFSSTYNGSVIVVADVNWSQSAYYTSGNTSFLRQLILGVAAGTTSGTITGSGTGVQNNLIITASGRNVDVVIFDGHIDPSHPEFAVNSNGTGGSRVVQYNWFQNNVGFGTGTYVYTPYVDGSNPGRTSDNDHGVHVAGTAVGNTQGWARDANIYNISIYGTNQNFNTLGLDASTYWDYVRAWHNNKPINAVTGRKNPTITNHSYGTAITYNDGNFGPVTRVVYRGIDFNPGRALTVAEMQARGFFTSDTTPLVPYYFTSREADIQDAINDGIIVMAAAGNESWKIVNSSDQDYNNVFYATFQGTNFSWFLNRGNGGGGAGYAPVITVGAVGINREEYKGTFSNCGSQVDIFAAGTAIQSSLHTASGSLSSSVLDSRNSSFYLGKYQGTSMATPQVTGIIACLAEHWPNIRQAEATQWLIDFSNKDQMGDTGEDSAIQTLSLQGAPNRFARWFNQRPVDGGTFPQINFRPRTVNTNPVYYGKRLWPRPRIRRRG